MNAGHAPVWPLPDPIGQPGPAWVFWLLLVATFAAHLLAMNVLVGGALVGAVARWRLRRAADERLGALVGLLARLMPPSVAATVTLGVAPLLFTQLLFGRALFTSSVLIAWWWLAVVPSLIAAYYASYWLSFRSRRGAAGGHTAAWAIVGLLAAIGFVYVNNMSLAWRPDRFAALYRASASGVHLNLADPTLLPRYLHMMLGAVAVGGLAVAVLGLFTKRTDEAQARWLVRHGARWFSAATGANLLVGSWWLAALPPGALRGLMGGDLAATAILALGIAATVVSLALLGLARRRQHPWVLVKAASWVVMAIVGLMVITRDHLRQEALASHGFRAQPWTATEWGPIVLFAASLLVALGSIWWMVGALVRGGGEGTGR